MMNYIRIGTLVVLLATIFAAGDFDKKTFEQGLEIEKETDSLFYHRKLTAYFSKFSNAELDEIAISESDFLALFAAWERVHRGLDQSETWMIRPIPQPSLAQFLGLVEGRLRMIPPNSWRSSLLGAQYFSYSSMLFGDPKEVPDRTGKVAAEGQWKSDKVIVKTNDQSYVLLKKNHGSDEFAPPHVWVYEKKDDVFVILSNVLDRGCELFRLDRKTGEQLWSAEAWGLGSVVGSTGMPSFHHIDLHFDDSKVTVFGCLPLTLYIEQFDLSTGKATMRFATTYMDDVKFDPEKSKDGE